MKLISIILLGLLFLQCNSDPSSEIDQTEIKADTTSEKITETEFSEYVFHAKDTIFETNDLGIQTQTINLGMYSTDSCSYSVIREFRLIPGVVEDSPRGRSTLYLITESGDSLIYDAGMPRNLPIDIYKNQFVFMGKNGQFEFAKIHRLEENELCFIGSHNACFL